jgi:glycosyltransferase EpsD
MLTRLAARKARKAGTRVVYTAHGFHFFTGAPLVNWLLYYPAERFLARCTDLLITINAEDYARAKRFRAGRTALVEGVGVDLSRFDAPPDRAAVRAALGIAPGDPVVITVGEHIPRKNHETCLRALARLPGATLLCCGTGRDEEALRALAQALNVSDRVRFLGFRTDVAVLLSASDAFLFPSLQEGLPVSLMEAMAAGLPCVVSAVRGSADLIAEGEGGYLRAPTDAPGMAEALGRILTSSALRTAMGKRNREAIRPYGLTSVLARMASLYREQLEEAR